MIGVENNVNDPVQWARRTAARLRATRASFSDQPAEVARPHLEDEVVYALQDADIAEDREQKELYLEHLAALFPVFGELNSDVASSPTESAPQALEPLQEAPPLSPVDAAVAAWESADPAEKEAIASALGLEKEDTNKSDGTILPSALNSAVNFPQSSSELSDFENSYRLLWSELGTTPEDPAEFNRILKLLGMYSKTLGGLHKAVWEFWNGIAPREAKSVVHSSSSGGLGAIIAPYLQGKEGASSQHAYTEIALINLLTTALIYGMQKGSEEFSRVLFQKLSPENIENAVVVEDTAANSNRVKDLQRKCWDKYVQLNRSLTPDALDEELGRSIGLCMAAFLKNSKV